MHPDQGLFNMLINSMRSLMPIEKQERMWALIGTTDEPGLQLSSSRGGREVFHSAKAIDILIRLTGLVNRACVIVEGRTPNQEVEKGRRTLRFYRAPNESTRWTWEGHNMDEAVCGHRRLEVFTFTDLHTAAKIIMDDWMFLPPINRKVEQLLADFNAATGLYRNDPLIRLTLNEFNCVLAHAGLTINFNSNLVVKL